MVNAESEFCHTDVNQSNCSIFKLKETTTVREYCLSWYSSAVWSGYYCSAKCINKGAVITLVLILQLVNKEIFFQFFHLSACFLGDSQPPHPPPQVWDYIWRAPKTVQQKKNEWKRKIFV